MASAPGIMAGGTKKPFSYCPGGIDFSQLKSPRMARRIAKHQAQMEEPSSNGGNQQQAQPQPLTMLQVEIKRFFLNDAELCLPKKETIFFIFHF